MKTKGKGILITIMSAFIFMLIIASCKKDLFKESVGVCPSVSYTNPINGATMVAHNQIIKVTFNEEMNAATINSSAFILYSLNKTKISGTVTYNDADSSMSFAPEFNLTNNTTYMGVVATTVKDKRGNSLQTEYEWLFSTGSTIAPFVSSTNPNDKDVDVVVNKVITATFNQPMDVTTINNTTFTVMQGTNIINGDITYTGTTVAFKPLVNLPINSSFTATIKSDVKSSNGVFMQNNYTWTFTTGSSIAPTVISNNPLDKEKDVALSKIILANFSEPMNPSSITGTSFTLKAGNNLVTGTVNYSGTTASFTPTTDLLTGTTYTATITSDAKNIAGISLANNFVWTFKTEGNLGGPDVDLKTVARFGIIAGVGVSNNAGFSVINNLDVGISPGVRSSITGFPPAIVVGGDIYASDDISPPGIAMMLTQAKQDLTDAYLFAEGATSPAPATVSGDQGGLTLAPGIYKSTSTLLIQSGDLTLDAQGDPNAVWIFQIASDFTTVGGAGGSIILSGGAQAKNIFWQTGRSATIGDNTNFYGNILALTSITMNANAVATGRMLARNGSVIMTSTNTINKP